MRGFPVTAPNHERLTNKTIPVLDPNLIFMKTDNNTKAVHRHCGLNTPSQFLGLYQVQNWPEAKTPETITTKTNCIASPIQMSTQQKQDNDSNVVTHLQKQTQSARQNIKDKHRAKQQRPPIVLKQPSSRRKEDNPSPALFSTNKPATAIISPHKRTSRNITTSKYSRLRAILEKLEDQEYSPNSPHTKNKKGNKTLHHFQVEVVNIMKEDQSRLIEQYRLSKSKKSSQI